MKVFSSLILVLFLCALPTQGKNDEPDLDEDTRRYETYDIRKLSCSACLAVVWEFGALLSQETKGVDYVNAKGQKIDYRKSDMRATLILEKLCPLMKGYGLFKRDKDGVSVFRRIEDFHHGTDHLGSHKLKLYCEDLMGEHEEFLENLVKLGEGLNAGDMEALAETVCVKQVKRACKTKEEALDKIPYREDYVNLQREAELKRMAAKMAEKRRGESSNDDDDGEWEKPAEVELNSEETDQIQDQLRKHMAKFGGSFKTSEEKESEKDKQPNEEL
eukprot:TRINITY_DN19904_c0_g1_i1.p1 TRINITY_DN19904_c0_g1~~TRINITY_DN19904_c0_g1_i1.p1  ORF type:complete len:274 (+),score=62.09 TRINITY_DN19904_c0_g1_i1:39-860(+)